MTSLIPDNLRFDLTGNRVKAELTTGGAAGLTLNLELQGRRHAFSRDQINVQALGIGTLVTVGPKRESELRWVDFSLLLPSLSLELVHSVEPITASAVQTTHYKGSTSRVSQSYSTFELFGTATLVWSADTSCSGSVCMLRVQGIFTFPREGYTVELRREAKQAKNSQERRLQLRVQQPSGSTPRSPTTVKANYLEMTCDLYTKVTVLPEGRSIPVQRLEDPFRPPVPCSDFKATQVVTSTPDLFEVNAEATCEVSSAAELRPTDQQGSNPDDLWLHIYEPKEPAKEPKTTVTLQYKKQTPTPYRTVVFLPDGPCIDLAPDGQELPPEAPPHP